MGLWRFTRAYIKSMRLYYAFVTGMAGWIGVSFYHWLQVERGETPDVRRSVVILVILFLSWGINQIINDYLGQAEDRVNAPHRPMVSGDLPADAALGVSIALLAGTSVVTWFLSPWALLPLAVGVGLNVLYEYAKAWSLLGNVVFGATIASCTAYGFLAGGPPPDPLFTSNRLCVLFLVALINGLMTYYTYFKDYRGDRLAGKKTFVVRHGLRTARWAGVLGAFLPTLAFLLFIKLDWLPLQDILFQRDFAFCGTVTIFLQVWTAALYFRHPVGKKTYFSLATNFRACVAGQVTLIAIFNGTLALYLLCASYVFIGFLFDLYKDSKA